MMKQTLLALFLFLTSMAYSQTHKNKLEVALFGGYGYRTAKVADNVPNDFKNYVKELKSGYQFDISASYYVRKDWGLGVQYNVFKASNSANNIYIEYENGQRVTGRMNDDIIISFIGPRASGRLFDKKEKNFLSMGIALGYLGYKNNSKVVTENIKITGASLGAAFDMGYNWQVARRFHLGAQASVVSGVLSKLTTETNGVKKTEKLEKDQKENLGRINFSAGARFIL